MTKQSEPRTDGGQDNLLLEKLIAAVDPERYVRFKSYQREGRNVNLVDYCFDSVFRVSQVLNVLHGWSPQGTITLEGGQKVSARKVWASMIDNMTEEASL